MKNIASSNSNKGKDNKPKKKKKQKKHIYKHAVCHFTQC